MTQKELIKKISEETGLKQSDVDRLTSATATSMINTMKKGMNIYIHGFGTFEMKKKEQREVINPQTRERTIIPSKYSIAFTPGKTFKEKVKNEERK